MTDLLKDLQGQKFKTICADPPWPMPHTGARSPARSDKQGVYEAKGGRMVSGEWWGRFTGKSVKIPYQTMTVSEIAAMPVSGVADKDAHLYLWTVNRHMEDAYAIARAWGFKPSTVLVWGKTPMGIGFGGTFCNSAEFCLFCRRGTLKATGRIDSTWWHWSRPYVNGHIAHSAKPEAFQDMVETVSPGPYLELFARRPRLNWTVWGNEVEANIPLCVKTHSKGEGQRRQSDSGDTGETI